MSWSSRKLRRKTKSTFSSELLSLSEALDKAGTNAKQISELQKSITKLTNDTERERTANKTFAANQLTTAKTDIKAEIQDKTSKLDRSVTELSEELKQQITTLEGLLNSRVQTVEQAIVDNDRLLVDQFCKETLQSLDQYQWDPNPNLLKEKPKHNRASHMADALRYALYSFETSNSGF